MLRLQLGMFPEAQAGHVEKSQVLSSQKGGAGAHFQPFSPHAAPPPQAPGRPRPLRLQTGPAPSGSRELSHLLAQGLPPQGTPGQPPAGFLTQSRKRNAQMAWKLKKQKLGIQGQVDSPSTSRDSERTAGARPGCSGLLAAVCGGESVWGVVKPLEFEQKLISIRQYPVK